MRTMEELRRRIANVQDVQSIVSTMKTMAAVQVRQYESAANAMAVYLNTVELGFHVLQGTGENGLLSDSSPAASAVMLKPNSRAAIVFGSDQGLCGKFNEVIVNHAISQLSSDASWKLIVVGNRAASLLATAIEAEVSNAIIDHVFRTPITVSDITSVMQRLLPIVNEWQLGGIRPIDVHFNIRTSASTLAPETFRLFPVSPQFLTRCEQRTWNSRRLPIYTDPQTLLAALIRQYLFVGLYRACAESRASENASRIAAMQAASKNIDRRLHELRTDFNESRQAAITEEILDIAAGVEALN